jgi:anthranilate phosphoribosyltransferase
MTRLRTAIADITNKIDLSQDNAETILTDIFTGTVDQTEITELLVALYQKGESVSEIVGFATAMRKAMIKIDLPHPIMDNCGTGGSGKSRFNVSSAAAILLASMGIPMAKHGNRGSKGPTGSMDFIEALGIPIDLSPEKTKDYFLKHNICFLFARNYHPNMKYVTESRKTIPHRTIFNLLGPLCNPANVSHQLIGTPNADTAKKLAAAAQQLGTQCTWVIVGGNATDELSPNHTSTVFKVIPQSITEEQFTPQTLNLENTPQYTGETASQNATTFKTLIANRQITHPIIIHVALNAAAAISIFNATPLSTAYTNCITHIQDGNLTLDAFKQ